MKRHHHIMPSEAQPMVATSTFISDTVIFIRDDLLSNVTDPISATRPANEKFVMTSYPQREVTYPVITVRLLNIAEPQKLGLQSELIMVTLPLEVRVWARNEKEKDELSQAVVERLRDNQLGGSGTIEENLHDFRITSGVNVDEPGTATHKSRVLQVEYDFILGAT